MNLSGEISTGLTGAISEAEPAEVAGPVHKLESCGAGLGGELASVEFYGSGCDHVDADDAGKGIDQRIIVGHWRGGRDKEQVSAAARRDPLKDCLFLVGFHLVEIGGGQD